MAKVTFYPDNITIQVEEGVTILEAARRAGVTIESPCNGVGVCGKCKVKLGKESFGNVSTGGKHSLSPEDTENGYVLSCEARISGDITVENAGDTQDKALKILSHGRTFDIELDGFIEKMFDPGQNLTAVYGHGELLGREEGDTRFETFGVVVDIGTTTLVASLVDLNTGEELDYVSALNPQAIHAQDVLSRIKLASSESGLKLMYSGVMKEIKRMILVLRNNENIIFKNVHLSIYDNTKDNTLVFNDIYDFTPNEIKIIHFNIQPKVIGEFSFCVTAKFSDNIEEVTNFPSCKVAKPNIEDITLKLISKEFNYKKGDGATLYYSLINSLDNEVTIKNIYTNVDFISLSPKMKNMNQTIVPGSGDIIRVDFNVNKSVKVDIPVTIMFSYKGHEYNKVFIIPASSSKEGVEYILWFLARLATIIGGLFGILLTTAITTISTNLIIVFVDKWKERKRNIKSINNYLKSELDNHMKKLSEESYIPLPADDWNDYTRNGTIYSLEEHDKELFKKLVNYFIKVTKYNNYLGSEEYEIRDALKISLKDEVGKIQKLLDSKTITFCSLKRLWAHNNKNHTTSG